ncbi:MAG: hypothetical protein ACQEV0_00440 [Bacillota bacterium]
MDKTKWDIHKVKRLKKKQLIQSNFFLLLLFLVLIYLADQARAYLISGMFFMLVLGVMATALYTLKTGRFVGTKTSKIIQEFDRDRLGKKSWKRRKIIEESFIGVLGIGVSLLLIATGFDSTSTDSLHFHFPFIGVWVGHNLGEIVRISGLSAD